MQLKKGDIVEVKITDLAFGGAGVGKMNDANEKNGKNAGNDFVVFVERAVPGDLIEARLTKIKKQYAEARLERIINPSGERIKPRCSHFGSCGGCSLQCLDYETQLKWKEKMVADAISKIGGIKDARIEPIIGCETPWFYRNKMEYTFGYCHPEFISVSPEMPRQARHDINLGLHPAKNFRDVFDLKECFLSSPLSVEILRTVKEWTHTNGLPSYDPQRGTGVLRNLVIREGKNTGETMVNLVTAEENVGFEDNFTQMMTTKFPQVTSLYRTAVTVQRGFKTRVKEFLLAGKPTIAETLAVAYPTGETATTLRFEILPQAFFQPNTRQAEILYREILKCAAPTPKDRVLDLFCGTGTISMFFANSGANIMGIDSSAAAIENAKKNARLNGISNVEFACGDAGDDAMIRPFDNLSRACRGGLTAGGTQYDIIITDPPRAGIAQKTLIKIIALRPRRWIYVSCNPTTLARDLKEICATGYKIQKIQPVDMFPHTYHVETVCLLACLKG